MRSAEARSTYLVNDRSWKLALPAPAPPPTCADPELLTPQLQASTSIVSLYVLSFDSPLISGVNFMNISTAIHHSFFGAWIVEFFRNRPAATVVSIRAATRH